jgi:hypothetical protein
LVQNYLNTNKGSNGTTKQGALSSSRDVSSINIFQQKIEERRNDENPVDNRKSIESPSSLDEIMNGLITE